MAETLGSLYDKLIIVKLKQWHTEDHAKAESLADQERRLQQEITEFVTQAVRGSIPPERLTFASNKVYTMEGEEARNIDGTLGELFSRLATINCSLWHTQEKVYDFAGVPPGEKDGVIRQLATLNLERNHCIDAIDMKFRGIVVSRDHQP